MTFHRESENHDAGPLHADYLARQRHRYLTFQLADREFGIGLQYVTEIRDVPSFIASSAKEPHLVGSIETEDGPIPIVDLRQQFELAPRQADDQTSLVLIVADQVRCGFIVDAVSEMVEIPAARLSTPQDSEAGIPAEFIKAEVMLAGAVTRILDPKRLFQRDS
ncbi:MAG: chemotaxis protein CheW [bacterium]